MPDQIHRRRSLSEAFSDALPAASRKASRTALLSALAVATTVAATVAATVVALPSCGGGGAEKLRIGLEAQYPPFESVGASGEVEGFDVDLARGLAAFLGREAEFRNMAFDALLPELQAGRIDAICSAMSWTEERSKAVSFTRPYVRVRMGVLVHAGKAAFAAQAADLDRDDVVIAVQRGTSGESKARAAFPKARVAPYETEVDASSEVAAGRAHAFVYDMVSVRKLAAKAGSAVRVLPGDLGSEDYCIAFAKGSPHTEPADRFLDGASAPGGLIETLMARWQPAVEAVPAGTGAAK